MQLVSRARLLSEEFFVSQVLSDSYVAVLPAKIHNLVQKRVISLLKLTFKADSSRLHANLKHAVAFKKLVETQLSSGVFFEDIPILNDVYQADFTLNYVAA
jgi:hemerythrin superfamily protein